VLGLTLPSSGSEKLPNTIVKAFCHREYVDCRTFINVLIIDVDMYTVIGVACRFECVHGLFACRSYRTHEKIDLGTLVLVGSQTASVLN